MGKIRTHYDNLHISRKADLAAIRLAYRSLCQKHHPDKNPEDRERAESVIKIINKAYEVLSDPAKRRRHDQWIATEEAHAAIRTQNARPSTTRASQQGGYRSASAGWTAKSQNASAKSAQQSARCRKTSNAATRHGLYGMRDADARSYGVLKAIVLCRKVQNSGGIILFISMLSGLFAAATYVVFSLY